MLRHMVKVMHLSRVPGANPRLYRFSYSAGGAAAVAS